MAQVDIITEKDRDLTRIVLTGKVAAEDIIAATETFYAADCTSKLLFDFSSCDVSALSFDDLDRFVALAKRFVHRRVDGRTAIVGNSDLSFGLGRVYTSLIEVERHAIPNRIFRTTEAALKWLGD